MLYDPNSYYHPELTTGNFTYEKICPACNGKCWVDSQYKGAQKCPVCDGTGKIKNGSPSHYWFAEDPQSTATWSNHVRTVIL